LVLHGLIDVKENNVYIGILLLVVYTGEMT
jgi:hypothetical protein